MTGACAYGRCGGKGVSIVKRRRRGAQWVELNGVRLWLCESCADLIRRLNRPAVPPDRAEQIGDYFRRLNEETER